MTIRRLLVTGHLGFIGSTFCELYSNRYSIAGVDIGGWGSMEQNLVSGVQSFRADIADPDEIQRIADEVHPDAIVNFAAESHVDRSNGDDTIFWHSNVMGARTLALQAKRRGIRMVHVSTDEVYGDATASAQAWTETSELSPKNPYAVTKAAAEMLLKVYVAKGDLDLVITRGANTIGPRQFPEKAIPKAIQCFKHGEKFPLFRTPARRMWMAVADHASGVEAALLRGRTGEVYNLAPNAASEAYTEDVIERVRTLIGKGEIVKVSDRDHYDLRYWMDSSKARSHLGWQAERSLDETLRETVEWYSKNSEWLEQAAAKLSNLGVARPA